MVGLGPGMSIIWAGGPNVSKSILVFTSRSSRGSSQYHVLSLASRWYDSLLSHGNVSKVKRDLSSSASNLSGLMPLRLTISSGRGSSYHSIMFRSPCKHIFLSNSFSLCRGSYHTPVAHNPLLTPHNIFLGDDSQHCNSFRDTLTLLFLRSTFTASISLCILQKVV